MNKTDSLGFGDVNVFGEPASIGTTLTGDQLATSENELRDQLMSITG